jgi:hypothetical protein
MLLLISCRTTPQRGRYNNNSIHNTATTRRAGLQHVTDTYSALLGHFFTWVRQNATLHRGTREIPADLGRVKLA